MSFVNGTGMRELFVVNKKKRNSQGKDARTFQENSQGGDLSTTQANSQGEDPRTFEAPVRRWRVQKERKQNKWKKKKKKKEKKKVKCRRSSWWKKCKGRIASFLAAKMKEEEKKCRKRDTRIRTRQVLGMSGRLLFLLVLLEQHWPKSCRKGQR